MGIDRDDRDERQERIDAMIAEFQDAQRRRLVRVSARPVTTPPESDAHRDAVPSTGAVPSR
jgi:hypothetical protein